MSSSPANSKLATSADNLLSKILNDLDVSFNNGAKVSTGSTTAPTSSTTNTNKKRSYSDFEDLLGPNFNVNNGATGSGNSGKSIGEMKKAETMKTMTAEEAQVFAWKDGKSRNLRALLCSLDKILWDGAKWQQCGMHQLVSENDVNKMYKKAVLAVHPDRQRGTENEELATALQKELNDASCLIILI